MNIYLTKLSRFFWLPLQLCLLLSASVQAQAIGLVWGEGNWGDAEWSSKLTEPVAPPAGPIPAAVKITTIGGQERSANFALGAYANTGSPTYANAFTAGDFVTLLGEVTPDPTDVGSDGELYAAFLSVVGGKATFSYVDEDGNIASWNTTIAGLGPVAIATPLEESHQFKIFEGTLQAGVHKFTFAYRAENGPLVYMKPITITVSP